MMVFATFWVKLLSSMADKFIMHTKTRITYPTYRCLNLNCCYCVLQQLHLPSSHARRPPIQMLSSTLSSHIIPRAEHMSTAMR